MSSRSLNKVTLIGNLTRDPELRYTPNGTAVATFGVATNRSWLPEGAAERREETEFHRIVAWNKLADLCAQLLYKGCKVYVEGRLQTRSWVGQDGAQHTSTEIVIDDMIVLDKRADRPASANYIPAGQSATASMGPATPIASTTVDDTTGTPPAAKTSSKKKTEEKKSASAEASADKEEDKEEKEEEVKEEEKPKDENLNPEDIPF